MVTVQVPPGKLPREIWLRGVALEHLDEGLEEVEVLLLQGSEVGADGAEG
jgi:hypothetical protein